MNQLNPFYEGFHLPSQALTRFFLESIIDNILHAFFSFFSKTVTIYRKGWFSLCFIWFQLCSKFQEP